MSKVVKNLNGLENILPVELKKARPWSGLSISAITLTIHLEPYSPHFFN